jgi:Exostosin family
MGSTSLCLHTAQVLLLALLLSADIYSARLQSQQACQEHPACLHYELTQRNESSAAMRRVPGLAAYVSTLGYASLDDYIFDAGFYLEAVYLSAAFCLTPPGNTSKRRGFWDAVMALCIPVVYTERTREYPWFLSDDTLAASTVLINRTEFVENRTMLMEHLQGLLPEVPRMRAALARVVTSLQYAYSELGPVDHAAVGPDAFDVTLYRMTEVRI